MTAWITTKDKNTRIDNLAPGGTFILLALNTVGGKLGIKFVITAGTDGKHGDGSKHYKGEALDVRSHDIDDALQHKVLEEMKALLGESYFYGFLEDYDLPNEHFHFQVRKNTTLPMEYALSKFALLSL